MDNHKSNIIWQSIVLIISVGILLAVPCWIQFSDFLKEILTGIASAVLLLLFIEVRNLVKEKNIYGYLNGEYERTAIFESDLHAVSETKYRRINYEGVNTKINFNYNGNRQYCFESQYREGKTSGIIYLDQINPNEGVGFYQYLSKNEGSTSADIGHYKLFVDTLDNTKLYIYYTNLMPSGLAQGYEIWQKL